MRSNEQTHPVGHRSGNNYRERESERVSLRGTAKPVQQIIALQINLRERAGGRCCPIFSVTILCGSLHSRSPQRVPEYMGGRYTQTSRLATWTRHLRPGIPLPTYLSTYPIGRKKRHKGGKEKSGRRCVAVGICSWRRAVYPRHCCGLSSRGGASKRDKKLEKEREIMCVCVWVSLVGGLKGRERYLKKLEEGGSRYGEKGTRRPSKYATS